MSQNEEQFDVEQGHGNHFDSVLDNIPMEEFLTTLPDLLNTAKVIGITQEKIACRLEKKIC